MIEYEGKYETRILHCHYSRKIVAVHCVILCENHKVLLSNFLDHESIGMHTVP